MSISGLLAWPLFPLLALQGLWVRRRTQRLAEAAGPRHGHCGRGPVLRLLGLGDSIIAGVGVETTDQALTARLAASLSGAIDRKVEWSSHGLNGARTRDLLDWAASAGRLRADLVIVSNGLNDVTAMTPLARWLARQRVLYRLLRRRFPGALIAQLGIPPLGHFPALPNPLRWGLGQRARAFDRALENLIRPIPGVIHMPFREIPEASLFAADGYHPGPAAVSFWAASLSADLATALALPSSRRPLPDS